MNYYPRYIDSILAKKLESAGAVNVRGPKACGKSTSCARLAASQIALKTKGTIAAVQADPSLALRGASPRLIDEWQRAPELWDAVKNDLDESFSFGKYILTGSANPPDSNEILDPGAGRITTVSMYPFSLYESKESSGLIRLSSLFDGAEIPSLLNENFDSSSLAYLLCRGGWPISLMAKKGEVALEATRNYYQDLFNFSDSDHSRYRNKNPELLRKLLRSAARNISTEASLRTLTRDVNGYENEENSAATIRSYLSTLEDLYILSELPAWSPEIRSKTSIRQTATLHFIDPSLATAALGLSPNDLINDFDTFGYFFEDMAVRDLRIYAESLGGTIHHYRDNAGLECDAVIHLKEGKYGLIEIKIGGEALIEKGVNSLHLLENKIKEKSNEPAPSFLMVLTGLGESYRRPDGVYVVALNQLRA